jgi:16S rRNA (cytosine967-C5)-methyltransferase
VSPGRGGARDARAAALGILKRVRSGATFDAALARELKGLEEADRRLAHEIAAGILRREQALDALLAPHVSRVWSEVPQQLQDILRIGAYQLTELERVPAHAAVSTSVDAATKAGGKRAGGFVNAVLRKVAARRLGGPADERPADDGAAALAAQHSHPEWLVARWLERFGAAETERLLRWNNSRPPLVLQAARQTLETIAERLTRAGRRADPAPYGAGIVTDRGRPSALPGYDDGAFVVQDPAQALLAWFADLPPDALVYDACAAPGGKTVALGRGVRGVLAADVSANRVARLAENLRRAGSGREFAVVADARAAPIRPTDAVLLDAPCLGTGTFARHPDARGRVTADALASLAEHQRELLDAAAQSVRPGGLLIYATCSLEPEENEVQVNRFIEEHPGFRREAPEGFPPALLSPQGDLLILPQRHGMDGAFAARLRREA